MTKLFTIATALLAAVTMLASGAEAGFKIRLGFGGPLPAFTAYGNSGGSHERHYAPKRRYQAARHHEKAPVRVTKKAASAPKIAKAVEAEPEAKVVAKAAETENSSIAAAETQVSEVTTPAPIETAAATVKDAESGAKIDCKKFFPSVGMTLTVPCE